MERLFAGGLVLLLAGCGPLSYLQSKVEPDLTPPVLLGTRVRGPELELAFDEPLRCTAEDVRIAPALPVDALRVEGATLTLTCAGQQPGVRYTVEVGVTDEHGNRLDLITELWGYNPRPAALLINEFTTQGSDTHPDLVELWVRRGGNLAGAAVYQGTPGDWDNRLVFPSFTLREGDYLLVHFKPQGIPSEIDETTDPAASSGLDASASAYDFWVRGGTGLSGNNGVLSLYDRPGGTLLDGVLYSNRSSASDTQYRGFGGAATLTRAEELVREGGWKIAGEAVRPEDAVNPEASTATRSLCRSSSSADADCAADWHIVPTRGATFGKVNSDEVYTP